MTNEEIRTAVLGALGRIAPELDPATLKPDLPLRDQADIDSMDFLNFLMGIHAVLGVDIPEAAYAEVATLNGCVAYVASHAPVPQSAPPSDR